MNPYKRKLIKVELDDLLNEYKPIGLIAGTEDIGKSTLQKAKTYLRVISRVGSGWDNIDLEYAEQIGIKVFRTIGVLNNSVAELTIGLIIDSLRNITLNNNQLKNGVWEKIAGNLLKNKTVGIIGFGEIGQTVGSLAKAFGCKVFYNDIKSYSVEWANYVSKRKLIENSDIITIHTNGDKETKPRVKTGTPKENETDDVNGNVSASKDVKRKRKRKRKRERERKVIKRRQTRTRAKTKPDIRFVSETRRLRARAPA
jgi:D-3-phosphoglycerate dehydrogenase